MNPLRVLHVSDQPIFNLGGVGRIVEWLIRGLSAGNRIGLAAPDAEGPAVPEDLASTLTQRITIPGKKWNREAVRGFLEQVRAGHYDLIHFHGGTFSFDAHLPWRSPLYPLSRTGIPWILSNHCAPSLTEGLFPPGYPFPARALKTALAWASKGFLLMSCRQEVFDSDENRGQISRWFPWAGTKMRTIYHSGIQGAPPQPASTEKAITIGNLGHFGWRKGQPDLLSAFAIAHGKFPQLRLVLAGPHGPDEFNNWIRSEIERLKLGGVVDLPGGLKDTKAFWDTIDIYVQPSRFEGAPMALMEALWQGKPAIGTRVSGIPEIIQENVSGLLVAPQQPEELAAAIEKIVSGPEMRHGFAGSGAPRILAQRMTRKQMVDEYLKLYARILPSVSN